ncbi:MAG: DUF4430 domain-containing protein [Euryarchaeota archaeon]|nr:DUF4430 domain-containing protein [Euryarchaeota archaeon]
MRRRVITRVFAGIAILATVLLAGCLGGGESVETHATLVIDFNGPEGPIHPGNLTVWIKEGGDWVLHTQENEGLTVWKFVNVTSVGTVLELTERAAEIGGFEIELRQYVGMGTFVEGIGGVQNERPGRGWQFEVNGEYATKSCDQWALNEGDMVSWKFAEMPW